MGRPDEAAGRERHVDIVVPIKQVPETSNVRMDPQTGTVIRTGVETVVNPLDLYAVETALRLRERSGGGTVTAITMGPAQAARVLKEAIAMGCDRGILVSDRKFAGSDTWATSRVLAEALKKTGPFDLVIAGERATDGDTSQVGPGIAAWLDLPVATYVAKIDLRDGGGLVVERLVEEGYQIVALPLPALVTVVKEIASVRLPTLRGKKRARDAVIPVLDAAALGLDPACLGLAGSPTRVVRIETPRIARGGVTVKADEDTVGEVVDRLLAFLEERGLP